MSALRCTVPELNELRRLLAQSSGLWNHAPLLPIRLRIECNRLEGLSVCPFSEDIIWRLWQAGFIRADVVDCGEKFGMKEAEAAGPGEFSNYWDRRMGPGDLGSWIGILGSHRERPRDVSPRFHLYRYFLLWRLRRMIAPGVHPLQLLLSEGGLPELAMEFEQQMHVHTSSEGARDSIHHWNSLCELAIVCEPVAFSGISRRVRSSLPDTFESARENREAYFAKLAPVIEALGLEKLEEWRREMCRQAQLAEPNLRVHVLLRLAEYDVREKLRGALGVGMLFLEMAESIRRVEQRVFNCSLPEEDEMGYTIWAPGARHRTFGSNRVLDAPRQQYKQLLRSFGLDPGIRVRCYVEGKTELGALEYAIGSFAFVEIINLHGQVVQSRRRGLAFRESLESDLHEKVFSFVILDSDKGENACAAFKAISDGVLFGEVYLSIPDFELGNFSPDELREIICTIASDNGADEVELARIREAMEHVEHIKEVMSAARIASSSLAKLRKDEVWGKYLMRYLLNDLDLSNLCLTKEEFERPIINALRSILQATVFHYDESRNRSMVDLGSGRFVKRPK